MMQAAVMAALDAATGARLDTDWLNGSAQAVIVDFPLPANTPPLLPPFSHTDHDFDALLRSRPESNRREILRTVAETLIESFGFEDLPDDVIRQERDLSPDDQDALLLLQSELCGEWLEGEGAERMIACVAIRAALRAMSGEADNFDALAGARAALGARWPALESTIRGAAGL